MAAILVTGATGAIGGPLLAELLAQNHRVTAVVRGRSMLDDRVALVQADVTDPALANATIDPRDIEIVIHAAADTRFRAPRDEQERVNVTGTQHMLAWARQFPRLRRFVLVSTTCVAGTRTGSIPENLSATQPEFVSFYEATKWHAEQLVAASSLPSIIVRLSTAIGSECDGRIARRGAIHQALRWLHRGLVSMLPGTEQTPIDLISTDLAAKSIVRCAAIDADVPPVVHIAAGADAIPLGQVLDFLVQEFSERSLPWRQRQLRRPLVVDRNTFDLFRRSVRQSGDLLFKMVLESTDAFLPGLLHPKVYETRQAESLLGEKLPLADWRALLGRVVRHCIEEPEACHA